MITAVEQRTPDLPVRIIAGDHRQAQRWAEREGLPSSRWRYVSGEDGLLGIRNVRIVWVGTFWQRRDFEKLCQMVDWAVASGCVVVDRNEVVTKGRKTGTQTDTETGTEAGDVSGSTGLDL